ncbi:hypothetical protein PPTG_18772 [Phytophthora nicotianae INRA-310]|uniref:Uncharacterized protein n=1 Tax=Phytophthora nicotianae (strain INRA-310) TaxID=761204 RepID=W2PE09_PHYN3|nr:hypothetical protein PPTG_18772 [Phytophthora nicotianae INRA-310]ETM99272.1 hypothetical protein PPTG_18772 [Phytophthora nicotianae INRA-310]
MLDAITDVQTFGLTASILYVKFLATSMMQARKSFAANTRMTEDKQLVCAMGLSITWTRSSSRSRWTTRPAGGASCRTISSPFRWPSWSSGVLSRTASARISPRRS